ncbi:DUF4351 domain-containing protein [Nocardia nova]|uniref:DUF4351 domain-containing protein n=1 Tax=Nocardia nova TaxID=37330 RepID=UPI0011DDD4CF
MTTAEQLRAEGQVRTLLRLLSLKFGSLPDDIVRRVQAANPAELEARTERILTATTLDQFFA